MSRFIALVTVGILAACGSTSDPTSSEPPPTELPPPPPSPVPDPSSALLFASSYVHVPDDDRLDLTTTWTLEAWVKLDKAAMGIDQDVIAKWAGGSSASYILQIEGTGKVVLGTNAGEGSTTFTRSHSTLASNTWYHLAASFNNGTVKLYLNGVLDTTATDAFTPLVSFQPLAFGRESNYPAGLLGGVIDEVRIWNVVRSDEEIDNSRSIRLQGNEPGLVGYWPFEEGGGQITLDATANHLDGRLGDDATDIDAWDPAWSTNGAAVE